MSFRLKERLTVTSVVEMMKSALITIDPISEKGKSFDRFCELVQTFQRKGFFHKTSIASVIHGSLYMIPLSWYQEMKGKYAEEALHSIKKNCADKFEFESAKVLYSDSHANEILVKQLCRYSRSKGIDFLVVSSNERRGLPYWILGSFSETAVLTSTLPVLVIKPQLHTNELSRAVRFLLAVDVAAPPNSKTVKWVANLANSVDAHIDIIYTKPGSRIVADILQQKNNRDDANRVLRKLQVNFKAAGVKSKIGVLEESKSVAHTLVDFAEKMQSWLIITTDAERPKAMKLLLGSTARRILNLTKRPFLSLHID